MGKTIMYWLHFSEESPASWSLFSTIIKIFHIFSTLYTKRNVRFQYIYSSVTATAVLYSLLMTLLLYTYHTYSCLLNDNDTGFLPNDHIGLCNSLSLT